MKLVVISEIPVSYRQGWFDHVSATSELDLCVVYLATTQSDRKWESPISSGHRSISLDSKTLFATPEGFFARYSPGLSALLESEDPDLVVIPGWAHPTCWQAARWCLRNNTPYGVTLENWKTQLATRVPQRVAQVPKNYVLSNASVALAAGRRSERYAGAMTTQPVRVLHANVADVSAASSGRQTATRRPSTVLYLGRLMDHKGIQFVLEMAPSLSADGIETLVAGDGPERQSIERLDDLGHLTYLGTVSGPQKFELLASVDVVVMPSLDEPWGVVLQEALAAGTPVVASTEVGASDDFITPESGAVVAADRGAIESAVRSWISASPQEREACHRLGTAINYSTSTAQLESIANEFARC